MSASPQSSFNLKEWIFTTDHKRIGVLYLIGAFAAFAIAGTFAVLIRLEQYAPGQQIFESGQQYNQALYFHGAVMILAFLIPALTGGFANYFLPLMIGAKDVAFPRINAFSVWLFYAAIILAIVSLMIPDPPDVMWTGYPPYSVTTEGNTAFYVFTVHLLGFSSILGAINFLVTVIYMRAPGMGWNQLNVFVWTILAAFVLQLIFIPVLASAVTMLLFDKYLGTHFFDPTMGGDVLLYQNLFWFYSHPAVYVILLPAVGILFEVISTMGKNPVFNYKACVYAGIGGVLGLAGEVWIHHLYVAGVPDWLRVGMMITTLLISVPIGLMLMSLWGTLYKASITFNTAMLYASACLFLLLVGGLTGIPLAMTVMTANLGQTSFVHAHFHFVMALFSTFSIISGVYFWFPKITGRTAEGPLGVIAFWINIIGVNVTFWPLFLIGTQGMPRRYWDYEQFPQFEPYHHVATYGAMMVALAMVLTLINWVKSAFWGEKAEGNVWGSKSLEWTHCPNPPGPGNFPTDVTVSETWTPYNYTK